jgi:Lectin C-type domain
LKHVPEAAEWFWVSASDINQAPGHFRWPDGEQVDNSTWQRGQPNDFGAGINDTCVVLDTNHGALFDEICDRESLILCEVPPALDYCF